MEQHDIILIVYKRDDEQAQVEPNRSVKLDHRNAVADRCGGAGGPTSRLRDLEI
ncbi:hypothetical protein FPSE_07822 [Fusarium pseudograminearum CS3096]|uniref:Uncharacterized protein n=1 Tax=Fusarium pseudograminearum (strain CS3096) TaxID=1028729 RepID=K3VGC9_FUSPC|nr:hypothetical protein FPSE_07822 [Fusarium pseudograminearum CS3096]EKJ71968.1 hypothetical protein FPSE_07822 [Fusarium pseudograminearum CS3096]